MRKTIIAGNWKMNKTNADAVAMLTELKAAVAGVENVGIVIGAPFTALSDAVKAVAGSNKKFAAENMYPKASGAYTGEVSPEMLKAIGVEYVILGHSERREYFAETNETVNKKMLKAFEHGITPIMCCGETLEQREQGVTMDFIRQQVKVGFMNVTADQAKEAVIAYEPIWAIGTGKTATNEIAEDVCGYIRGVVAELYGQDVAEKVRIQYGGSVKPATLKALLEQPNIDGALVGGASLQVESYVAMIEALND